MLVVLLCLSTTLVAQSSKVVSTGNYMEAYKRSLIDNKEEISVLLKAKEAIDAALSNDKTKNLAKTWLYKGQVETLISQSKSLALENPNALTDAINAFTNVLTSKDKKAKKYKGDAISNLKTLGELLFNNGAESFNAGDFKKSFMSFAAKHALNNTVGKFAKSKMPMDTSTIQNAAIAAGRANMAKESAEYYGYLYEAGIKDKSNLRYYISALEKAGDIAKAEKIKKEMKKLFPNDQGLIIDEINQMLESGKIVEAIGLIRKAIDGDKNNHQLHFVLGNALKEKGDYQAASSSYNEALRIKPDFFDAIFNLGTMPYNQAADLIKQMNELGLDEQAKYDALKSKSNEYFRKALPFFTKALEINKGDRNTLIALREIYARLENYTELKKIKGLLGQ